MHNTDHWVVPLKTLPVQTIFIEDHGVASLITAPGRMHLPPPFGMEFTITMASNEVSKASILSEQYSTPRLKIGPVWLASL